MALQKVKNFLAENKVLARNVWRRTKVSDIHGVYLPFMLVDANVHVSMDGSGKILEKRALLARAIIKGRCLMLACGYYCTVCCG